MNCRPGDIKQALSRERSRRHGGRLQDIHGGDG